MGQGKKTQMEHAARVDDAVRILAKGGIRPRL